MFKPSPWPLAPRGEPPLPGPVRAFLVESERRVLSHCDRLLARENLPDEERQRLLRLALAANQELQRLGAPGATRAA